MIQNFRKTQFVIFTIFTAFLFAPTSKAQDVYQKLQIEFTGGPYKNEVFQYRLMAPEKIEPNKKYPLVLFLHGAGERGDNNLSQLKFFPEQMATPEMRAKFPCFVLAPQCRSGKKWVDYPADHTAANPLKNQPTHQLQAAIKMLERTIAENPIDTDRIYLTGLSMGGYGSWDLLARYPKKFAAAVISCGGGDPAQAEKLVDIPIWDFHGRDDQVVPAERSRKMVQAIQDAGGEKIKYTELRGVGHASWIVAYADGTGAIKWMFEQ